MTEPAIAVRQLHKSFGDLEVLKGIDFHVEPGEVVCVIGPSGSGKSTLLRCINRLEDSQSGQILIEGEDITDPDADVDQLRTRIGMVFQQFNLFPHLSVLKNLTIGPTGVLKRDKAEAATFAAEMLDRVGLADKIDAYPSHLSGGQQQRVFLARALAQEADLYLMDEPFVGIDATTEKSIIDLLKKMKAQGKTVVIVHHDLQSALSYFDWAILLNTRLVASGPLEKVFTPALLQETYGGKLSLLAQIGELLKKEQFPTRQG